MVPELTVRLEQGQPRREKLSQGGTPPSIPGLPEDGEAEATRCAVIRDMPNRLELDQCLAPSQMG